MTTKNDGRAVRARRRGTDLERAIYEAVFAELGEVGYRGLTMDGVALRAGAGKSSLYRRWSDKQDLVLRAVEYKAPELSTEPVDTGALRSDLITMLTQLSAMMAKPIGRALYTAILEMTLERQRQGQGAAAVIDTLLEPRMQAIMTALRRAARRGEVRPAAVSELLVRVGPTLVVQQQLQYGHPPTPAEIVDIVDRVLLAALQVQPVGTPAESA